LSKEVATFQSTKIVADKIRNVGDDILDVMENAGGHTLEKHVGRTNNELTRRAARDSTTDVASTFADRNTAINTVKENLRNNAAEIARWLKGNPSSKDHFVAEFLHENPVGHSVSKGNKTPTYDLTKSRVCLRPDPTNELGFKIITAFPIDV
jgi:superfamily II DNA helicase RecQ